MNLLKKSSLTVITGLLAFAFFASNVVKAETNPFTTQDIVTIVAAESKGDKCGEGKCGESKAKAKTKCGEGK